MSGTCGNCDCADKNQCPKRGSGYSLDVVQTENTGYDGYDDVLLEVPETENDYKCKCGSSCSCTDCTCGGQ